MKKKNTKPKKPQTKNPHTTGQFKQMHRKQFSNNFKSTQILCETFSESYTEKRQVPKSELRDELYRQDKKEATDT